ncbi:MAG: hypothetical protein J5714_01315 [Alphaproteobacteria bacterium]|nr:hypothetical protein [Alphaproteobacteria bacterium]
MENYNISDLLPHRPPMQLITAVESVDFDAKTLVARVDVTKNDLIYDERIDGIPSWISLEYMAQAVGCFIGAADRRCDPLSVPAVGFVLGSRKLSVNIPTYLTGQSYFVHVKSVFYDKNIANFDCQIYNSDNELVATGAINVFRPDDIKQFMDAQNE